METDSRGEIDNAILTLAQDRVLAHKVLFPHRHPQDGAEFHPDIIKVYHDNRIEKAVTEAFRGGAKSTLVEECVIIRALFREFHNCLVVGASEERAMERLESVKHEIDHNEEIEELFGILKGDIWAGHKVVTRDDIMIQARGVGQSLRGLKHHQYRPDFCIIDDLEDEDSVRSPEMRKARLDWLYKTLLPALEPGALVRFIGNRLDNDAVIVKVARDKDWYHQRFPIRYKDKQGKWQSSWPSRFPIEKIEKQREEYRRLGQLDAWEQEYMCEADNPEAKIFRPDMIRVKPRVRSWEATWMFFDPARTVTKTSADTGYACWSYVGSKIVVWEGWSRKLMPDEQINEIFSADTRWNPVAIGVERDGLNEWLAQPLRNEIIKRAHTLPIRPVIAPGPKLDFISGTQPFFNAGEVEFATEEAAAVFKPQILSFPKGIIDAFNALAYFTKLRPGLPIYDEFTQQCVTEEVYPANDRPIWLVLNATNAYMTGVLLQYADGFRIIADYAREGDPGQVAMSMVNDAQLEAGRAIKLVCPAWHYDKWKNVGLPAAIGKLAMEAKTGGDSKQGREQIRSLLQRQHRGLPMVLVSKQARWVLNGFSGGYCRAVDKGGTLSDEPSDGAYRVMFEGLESFAALLQTGAPAEESDERRYREGRDGRLYLTAFPTPR